MHNIVVTEFFRAIRFILANEKLVTKDDTGMVIRVTVTVLEHETIINYRRFYACVEFQENVRSKKGLYRSTTKRFNEGVRLFFTTCTFMVDARWSKIWVANEVVEKTRPLVFSVKESVPLDSPERSLALHRRFNWLSKARWSARERLPFYALLVFTGRSRSGNNVKILMAIFSFWVTATYSRFCTFEILDSSTKYQTPTSWKFAKCASESSKILEIYYLSYLS